MNKNCNQVQCGKQNYDSNLINNDKLIREKCVKALGGSIKK